MEGRRAADDLPGSVARSHLTPARPITLRRRTNEILDGDARDDLTARRFSLAISILITVNVICVVLETVPSLYERYATLFLIVEAVSIAIFTAELLLRLWSAPEAAEPGERDLSARLRYLRSSSAIIDILAIAPAYLYFFVPFDLRFLRVLRLLRILKLTRYSHALHVLVDVLLRERGSFLACLYILGLLIVIAASGAYLVEHQAQPEKFGSIPDGMWWAVATLTTVGYGDVTPITPLGKFFGALITILGIGVAALPAGILASGLAEHLAERRNALENEYKRALMDGLIDAEERSELETLRRALGISRERARIIEEEAHIKSVARDTCPHCGKPI